jgi:hypothetical protein
MIVDDRLPLFSEFSRSRDGTQTALGLVEVIDGGDGLHLVLVVDRPD